MSIEDEGEDTLAESIAEERGKTRAGGGEPEEEETETEEVEEEASEEESEEEPESEEEEEAAGPDETEEEEESEEDQGERGRAKGRGQERIRRQAEELSRLRAENENLKRGGGGGQQQPVRRAPADPAAMRKAVTDDIAKTLGEGGLALMTPAQQADAIAGSIERVMGPVMRQFAGSVGANQDRQAFREKFGSDPKLAPFYKRFNDKVESKFAEAQAQGFFIPREQFFKEMVADAVLNGLDKGGGKQRRERDIRRIKAGGVSTRGKGDVGGGKRKETRLQGLEKRLTGVKI